MKYVIMVLVALVWFAMMLLAAFYFTGVAGVAVMVIIMAVKTLHTFAQKMYVRSLVRRSFNEAMPHYAGTVNISAAKE